MVISVIRLIDDIESNAGFFIWEKIVINQAIHLWRK